jgi:heme-degrading monooxygenase HmoA
MYARTTTLMADPTRMDDGIADVRDNVMPTVLDMDGCTGLSMLCDRTSGRCIVTTGWETQDAMAATRDRVRALRERAAGQFGSGDPEVQEWEIAVMHRLHPATDDSRARVGWSHTDPGRVDEVLDAFRSSIIPRMDDIPGFCSLSLLIDRERGLATLTTVYADRASIDATREMLDGMRDQFAQQMGVTVDDEAEFDVVLHQLRVPELV